MPDSSNIAIAEASRPSEGYVTGGPLLILRVEGAVVLACAVGVYFGLAYSWVLLAVLFFSPDVAFAVYWAGPRAGAVAYNFFHSYLGPIGLGLILFFGHHSVAVLIIWGAHVGFDRMLGYGLKYRSGFGSTHLGRIGKKGLGEPR